MGTLATINTGDPAAAPIDVTQVFGDMKDMLLQVFLDNLTPIIVIFTFYLAVRFGPALLSWYRHRNDPKQLSMF